MIEVDLEQFQRDMEILDLAGSRSPQFIRNFTRGVGRAAMTPWRKAVTKQAGVKARDVQRVTKTQTFADLGDYVFEVKVSADYTYLSAFSPRQTKAGVEAAPWGGRQVFLGTFMADVEYGMSNASPLAIGAHQGVFMRVGDDRLPIKQLYGPNIAIEAVRDDPPETFEREVERAFNAKIQTEISRLFD